MKPKICLTFLLLFSISLSAQLLETSAEINLAGLGYSRKEAPFWLYSNKRGRLNETANFAGWGDFSAKYYVGNEAYLETGAGVLFQDGYVNKVQADQLYMGFQNSWLSAVLGRKHKQELYSGLSASNQNILWSLNARPLPGIQLETKHPLFINGENGLGFEAAWEEYITDDDRYVRDTRIHHKSFHLVYRASEKFQIKAGLQHFVEWAGTSPDYGPLPSSFQDYLRMIAGREGTDAVGGEEANALGNQLGSYEVYIDTKIRNFKVQFFYNHLFEDGSGRILRNTPDGRYGIYVEDHYKLSNHWVDAFLYELYYTKNQSSSHPTSDGQDNYFNNNLYRSGWTYESRVLGVPFITLDENRFRIANNTLIAHHFGIDGKMFGKLPYKLLTSYRINYGAKGGQEEPIDKILSSYLELAVLRDYVDIDLQVATDFNTEESPNFGAGIKLSKKFFED